MALLLGRMTLREARVGGGGGRPTRGGSRWSYPPSLNLPGKWTRTISRLGRDGGTADPSSCHWAKLERNPTGQLLLAILSFSKASTRCAQDPPAPACSCETRTHFGEQQACQDPPEVTSQSEVPLWRQTQRAFLKCKPASLDCSRCTIGKQPWQEARRGQTIT